jgi:hypothetical protein
MKQQFVLNHNGQTKHITIEPSLYQDKHLYEVMVDGNYFVLYQENNEWKHNQEDEISQDLLEQLVEKVEQLKHLS